LCKGCLHNCPGATSWLYSISSTVCESPKWPDEIGRGGAFPCRSDKKQSKPIYTNDVEAPVVSFVQQTAARSPGRSGTRDADPGR
jgi:hypothetical protein